MIWSSFIQSLFVSQSLSPKMQPVLSKFIPKISIILQIILLIYTTIEFQKYFTIYPHFPKSLSLFYVLSFAFFSYKIQKYHSYLHLFFYLIYLSLSLLLLINLPIQINALPIFLLISHTLIVMISAKKREIKEQTLE